MSADRKKLLIIANSARELELFKGDFIDACLTAGFSLAIICRGEDFYLAALKSRGAEVYIADSLRNSLSMVADLKYSCQLYKIIRQIKPQIILNYTIKPIVYASLVAKVLGVKTIISLFPGLGYIFSHHSLKFKISQFICVYLYKLASCFNQKFIFINVDDQNDFLQRRILAKKKTTVIDSEGINLQHFNASPFPEYTKIVFLFIARLLREKGIVEFIQAAKLLSADYPNVEFRIAGDCDEKTDSKIRELIEQLRDDGVIKYLGYVKDIRQHIAASHVFVLPSYYREGVPRSSMECMAMGRPIITTDWIGCKETVNDGENGYLVPIRNVESLSASMRKFIDNPELIPQMGKNSRQIAERRFDMHKINHQLLTILRESSP